MTNHTLNEATKDWRHWIPTILRILAVICLAVSILFPYWHMTLLAPQYPDGLSIRVFVDSMIGDEDPTLDEVHEIDGLNHYIGMRPMSEAAGFERSIAIPVVIIFAALVLIAAVWRSRWSWLLTVPTFVWPAAFLADLAYWLRLYGNTLDPSAPLSSAIKPFTPPVLGVGTVGQFKTIMTVGTGWYFALAASLCVLAAALAHSRMSRLKDDQDDTDQ